jgi:hypothetical protein
MSDMRKNCIKNIFFRNANILKFGELMNQTKLSKLKKLCVFVRFINNFPLYIVPAPIFDSSL